MNKSSELIKLLAKITEISSVETSFCQEKYKDLFYLLKEDFYKDLNESSYPQTPDVDRSFSHLLSDIKTACTFYEVTSKPLIMFAGECTNSLFFQLKSVLFNDVPEILYNEFCKIPFLIKHDESCRFEVINYANNRIPLDFKREYSSLLKGCREKNLALRKMVKMLVISLPLKHAEHVYVFDNSYGDAARFLSRFASCKIFVMKENDENIPHYLNSKYYNAVISGKALNISNTSEQVQTMQLAELESYIAPRTQIPLFGFLNEYHCICGKISAYFSSLVKNSEKFISQLSEDIIRMDKSDKLSILKENEIKRVEKNKENWNMIKSHMYSGHELVVALSKYWKDYGSAGKFVTFKSLNYIFQMLFTAVENYDNACRKEALSQLKSISYKDFDLVELYAQTYNMSEHHRNYNSHEKIKELKSYDWAMAKILVAISPIDEITLDDANKLISIIGDHISSGKEYYLQSILAPSPKEEQIFLHKSFDKGYLPAGERLINYPYSQKKTNLVHLANNLLPEACIAVGDLEMEKFFSLKEAGSIPEKELLLTPISTYLTYYKLAAAQNSLVAKGKIVDYLFNEHFSEARQIEDVDKENIAKVICYLAQELIDKSHRVYHYREILGVTLFCMKKYSAAKDVLLKLRGQEFVLGRFCLGYMYEYGWGTEKDFDESLRFYEKAKEFPKTKERTKAVKNKKYQKARREEERQEQEDLYDEDESYSSTSTSSTSKGSSCNCSIVMVFCLTGGLANPMKELANLKAFRDNQFSSPAARQVVQEFYKIGPKLKNCIKKDPDATVSCSQLASRYIKLFHEELDQKNFVGAKRCLVDMQLELYHKYNIKYNQQILQNYLDEENKPNC